MKRPRLRRVVRHLACLLVGMLLGYVAIYEHDHLLRGYFHFCAHRVTSRLPYVDRIEVNLLAPLPLDGQDPAEGFPISGYGKVAPIIETIVVRSAEARKLAALWRRQDFDFDQQGLCHDGVYGLRFFNGKALLFETSVCFHCHNFYVPIPLPRGAGGWWGFDADSEQGRALWSSLDQLAPYALREPAEEALRTAKENLQAARDAAAAARESRARENSTSP